MSPRVLELFRCPVCRGRVIPAQDDPALRCLDCGRSYPVVDEIPRLLPSPQVSPIARSFAYQWRARDRGWFERRTLYGLSPEDERADFFARLGIGSTDLAGKTILDAGCGDGFLLEILARYSAEVVGIDIQPSIDVAHRRCRHLPNVAVLQADVLAPPFAPETFDGVWCEGVLVYTDDPRKAFAALAALVRPGGRLYVWVYPSERLGVYQRIRDLLRIGHHLPWAILLALCYALGVPLAVARRLRSPRARSSLRVEAFALFDNLSPRVQSRHTVAEVRAWFEESGFVDLRQTGLVGMSGRRAP